VWALVPAVDFFIFLKAPIGNVVAEGETPMIVRDLFKSGFFWIAMILMICSGSSELTMSQWSSLFAEKGLRVSKLLGDLLGPCLFAVLMGATRALYGVAGSKIDIHKALIASGALCVVCYATTVFAANPIISLIGCAVCGVSVGLMWPGTLSFSAARFPMGGTAMFGVLAVCGDIGGAFGPWLAGVVSDAVQKTEKAAELAVRFGMEAEQIGLKAGLLLGLVFPVCMFIALIALAKSRKREG
ncbi:MAG: MFS transporter, partial [Clostridia bacterium]|nr:MFS transporter [Clostridia bacterium]